ncbi:hypothetical protein HELRODRAFT_100036 [Helobdella robusta]|uniref:F-box domain-containing protein n=1 Tax=Helobdella robusta TaxID=6412 RepID=T1ECY3_HELRO|nr:hypothetical protein HELRODRAFT_100036 [Helobdella robusta]ESO03779.1 hypothetical protein HELRODRAFT_100036 [Helobdella robusta]
MPFLGRDWRSPGQHWVKDAQKSEWVKMDLVRRKVLVDIHEETCTRKNIEILRRPLCEIKDNKDETAKPQPYVIIKQPMKTSVAEALVKLGVAESVKDIRKVNYICKLMQELVRNQMTSLSGSAQKYTMKVIEQIIANCISNNYPSKKAVSDLLNDLETTLVTGFYNHVGSASLWEEHHKKLDWLKKILQPAYPDKDAKQTSLEEKYADVDHLENKLTLKDLPLEMLHEVMAKLTNHEDLNNTIEAVFSRQPLEEEELPPQQQQHQGLQQQQQHDQQKNSILYRNLISFHFPDKTKWRTVLRRKEESVDELTSYELYMRLLRRYGPRETYADMLNQCRHCQALYWAGQGHPCFVNNVSPVSRPIPPHLLADLFVA